MALHENVEYGICLVVGEMAHLGTEQNILLAGKSFRVLNQNQLVIYSLPDPVRPSYTSYP